MSPGGLRREEGRDVDLMTPGEVASASHPFATLNALVMTSAVISARFSTGSGQVGVVEIASLPGHTRC